MVFLLTISVCRPDHLWQRAFKNTVKRQFSAPFSMKSGSPDCFSRTLKGSLWLSECNTLHAVLEILPAKGYGKNL
jgi:hypothetical protein